MFKLVVVDFDDTLCLTEKATFKLENYIASKMGFAPMKHKTHLQTWGMPVKEAIVKRFPGIDIDLFAKNFEKYFKEFIERGDIDVISDLNLKTLDRIRNRGIKTAILTSRTYIEIKHFLHNKHPPKLKN